LGCFNVSFEAFSILLNRQSLSTKNIGSLRNDKSKLPNEMLPEIQDRGGHNLLTLDAPEEEPAGGSALTPTELSKYSERMFENI
jgi:hypothetical protein